jgi:hypothetical protein
MKVMYDSIISDNIPENVAIVAGYVDGKFMWTDDEWARHPSARQVRIAVFASTNDGDVLDVEQYDASPADCPAWIAMRQAGGVTVPTIYCALSVMCAVQAACAGLVYDLWIADWTGAQHMPDGADACQYAALGTYDLSLCSDAWPR